MNQEPPELSGSIASLPQRVAAMVELLATLDLRVRSALEGLEEMRRSVAPLGSITDKGDGLLEDINRRSQTLEARVNRDLDELKAAVLAKLSDLDLGAVGARLDRLEAAVLNIERATVHLDEAFQNGLEALPDFMSKRLRPS